LSEPPRTPAGARRAEPTLIGEAPAVALDAAWRAAAERAQAAALPRGRVAVSCPAPLGRGGLGRHLAEVVAAVERDGGQASCLCEAGGSAGRCRQASPDARWRAAASFARPLHAWRVWAVSAGFDAAAARALPDAEHLVSFNGTSCAQFSAARRAGFRTLYLMAANSHMRHVIRRHQAAHERYPLEAPWATRLLARNLREYGAADRILVTTRYSWQSFVQEGISQERLSIFPLTPHPRFSPARQAPEADTFDVVYVGALTVHKGVPLLIDAVRRLPFADLRLVLVGGWKTRGMRRFLQAAMAADRRISVSPGDPLPRLRQARLYAHAAYEDGFAYAPAEALACGVPVIVSEDTGMKELIGPGRPGLVLPTGELEALGEAIAAAYRGELFGD
jgi:glycosyltransferase involved in cell wall biosynthesis